MYNLCPFSLFSCHLVYFVAIFYGYLVYFPHFGVMCQEKSGNPDYGGLEGEFEPIFRCQKKRRLFFRYTSLGSIDLNGRVTRVGEFSPIWRSADYKK
jgi:hypothetical protein